MRAEKYFRIHGLLVSIHGDLYVLPSRCANSPREINEAQNPGWIWGLRDQETARSKSRVTKNLPRFRAISLSLAVCAAARGNAKVRGGGLKILINYRELCAILYII